MNSQSAYPLQKILRRKSAFFCAKGAIFEDFTENLVLLRKMRYTNTVYLDVYSSGC